MPPDHQVRVRAHALDVVDATHGDVVCAELVEQRLHLSGHRLTVGAEAQGDEVRVRIQHVAPLDEAAAKAHKTTPHYDAWRTTTGAWFVEPRVGVRYEGLFPERAAG